MSWIGRGSQLVAFPQPTLLRPATAPGGVGLNGSRKGRYRHDFRPGGAGVRPSCNPSPAGLPVAVEVAALAPAVGWPWALVADTIAGRICQGVEVVALASGGGADTIAARLIYKQFLFPGVEVAALAAASGGGANTIAAGSAGGASTGKKKKPLQPTLLRPAGGASTGYRKSPYRHDFQRGGLVSVRPSILRLRGSLRGSLWPLRCRRQLVCWWPTLLRAWEPQRLGSGYIILAVA